MRVPHSSLPVLLLGLGSCSGGDSSASDVTNLGLSVNGFTGADDLWALEELEFSENADLNGDGDIFDAVLRVYDHGTGEVTDLELAFESSGLVVGGDWIAFGVREASQGDADLNGDGDVNDSVLHVYDHRSRLVMNTGLASGLVAPVIGLGRIAFDVSEVAQGTDLDGDGTLRGGVLHVYDPETRVTTNVGREVTSPIQFHGLEFVLLTSERSVGDLNGDGDANDERVFTALDAQTGILITLPLTSSSTPQVTPSEDWYLLTYEGDQGLDLNGDGDLEDGVYQRIGPQLQTFESLGIQATQPLVTSNGTYVALLVQELDGFGLGHSHFVLYDQRTSQTFEPALDVAADAPPVFLDDQLAVLADEFTQDEDLNRDGDRDDRVLHLLDPVGRSSTNLGFDAGFLRGVGQKLLLARGESAGQDWNSDGDTFDPVFFVWDPLTGELVNTHRAQDGFLWSNSSSFLFAVDELQDGRDWNDNGDLDDVVYMLYDLGSRRTRSLGLAAFNAAAGATRSGVLFPVSEAGQLTDLNGDGDLQDGVLHGRD